MSLYGIFHKQAKSLLTVTARNGILWLDNRAGGIPLFLMSREDAESIIENGGSGSYGHLFPKRDLSVIEVKKWSA